MSQPAATSSLIPREVLFGNPQRLAPALSPDGTRLAWIAPHQDVLNVWVRDLYGDAGTERPVTSDRNRGVHVFFWAPDGSRILYLHDENGAENLYVRDVHLNTGAERDLTPTTGVQARLAKVSKHHQHRILVGLNVDNPQLHDAYSLDLATGELTKTWTNPGFIGFLADEAFQVRAGMQLLPDGGLAIVVRDSDSSDDWRPLLRVGHEDVMSTQPVAFSADGTSLLCITPEGAETSQLVRFTLATGEREVLASDPVYDVTAVAVHHDTGEPRIVYVQPDRLDLLVLDHTIKDTVAGLNGLDGGDLQVIGTDHADEIWLLATVHDDGPIRYYTHDRATDATTFQFAHRPDLDQYPLSTMEPFTVTSRDGLDLQGYVTFPPGLPRQNLPAVLLVHGGPWHRDTWGFNPEAQWIANRGRVCIQVNYRGSSGYGKAFLNHGDRQWGAKMHDDLLDVLGFAIAQGWVDDTRVAIYGASFGGYASLVGATFTPDTFAAAISVAGFANIKTLIEAIPPYWVPMRAQAVARIGDPDTEADFLWSRSPLSRVDQITTPLMIVQGATDPRVPQAESDQIVAALNANNVPYEYLLFPDEGHGLVKPVNRLRFYAQAEAFLAKHLGGAAEPQTTPTTATDADPTPASPAGEEGHSPS